MENFVKPQEDKESKIWAPVDGKIIATIPRSGADDVLRAVQSAKSAQKNWSALTLEREQIGYIR